VIVPMGIQAMQCIVQQYLLWYNGHRPHTALAGRTPDEVFERQRTRRRASSRGSATRCGDIQRVPRRRQCGGSAVSCCSWSLSVWTTSPICPSSSCAARLETDGVPLPPPSVVTDVERRARREAEVRSGVNAGRVRGLGGMRGQWVRLMTFRFSAVSESVG
jgi:hypothetical protein